MRFAARLSIVITLIACLLGAINLQAQATTATLRGKVTNEQGAAVAGAEINAVNTATGFVHTVNARADGSYNLGGITPGMYNLVVAAPGYEPLSQDVTLLVGQTVDLNIRLSPTAVLTETITVVGNQVVDTRATEIATNVTRQQIESLPQNERNFLNFAALAPGITLSTNPERKGISAGAETVGQSNCCSTNVFIDGVSQKNDILQGGIVGGDASRGNMFPQNAVQEFRVITQNYSAQYEKAANAIITAVTKSGGNQFDGDVHLYYQPKEWVSETERNFQFGTVTTNPDYRRYQSGLSLGGPITRDRMHFFASYEGDDEHATRTVAVANPLFRDRFAQYEGNFASPFEMHLVFGKLSWQPASSQLVDVSGNYRTEKDIRDFGGQTSFEAARDIKNWVYGATLRHQWTGTESLNQASLSWQIYRWGQKLLNPDLIGRNYQGIIRIGGNSTDQDFKQRRIELRDDFTFAGFEGLGTHTLQVGGNIDFMNYDVVKGLDINPVFQFRSTNLEVPFEAAFGFGDPNLSFDNQQLGLYVQDSWIPTSRLNVNVGLRWDYESNMLDADYVTPPQIIAAVRAANLNVPDRYFSTGNNREPYMRAFQPRLGISYDLTGNSRSVVFGGWGRYYDRIFLDAGISERFREQFPRFTVRFSETQTGPNQVIWDPKYFNKQELHNLAAIGAVRPEIFLNDNETEPPRSDQWNIGFRQAFGSWVGSVSYNSIRLTHGFTHRAGNPHPDHGRCCGPTPPGFGNVLLSDDTLRRWFDGFYVTLDRPFTGASRWGFRMNWTHGEATQTGNDLFSLDYPTPDQFPRHVVPGTEKDRVVLSGMLGLPMDFLVSSIITLGSGAAREFHDFSGGFGAAGRPFAGTIYPETEFGPFAYRTVDLRLQKGINLGPTRLDLIGEAFNIFNTANLGCLANFIPPEGNPNFGNPTCVVTLGRRFQAGLRVAF